ncbi:NAD dependent epimerase/dehydratase family protein [Lepidopterella palustris CBS 459.81]|uniref:NAD dependent epimerase/dehydratase family protein n=1 Tax=Lepidopterella palustris CBS 459.81 TaxID=1314670 RepID=A0A8E2JIK3_9PEZI|nr:NAD dependent epimerase/dehydratase family protein [Lepidopterella palustris CBS 459.81]
MVKILITGATGYIGGDALYALSAAYPSYSITALVRNSTKGATLASIYPSVRLVYGDLDSTDLLTTEASNADIVLHCAHADHPGAAAALVAGLAQRAEGGFLIHTSGTGTLCVGDLDNGTFGIKSEKLFNDLDGIAEITSLPDHAPHRNVDTIVLAAGAEPSGKVRTAIVCPSTIYGPGRGPDNKRSIQVYEMAKAVLQRGKGFQVNDGQNIWTQIHIQDLSNAYVRLVEEAVKGGGSATWGAEGYYFVENGDFKWADVATAIADYAAKQKLIRDATVEAVSREDAEKLFPYGSVLWGLNSRARGLRAKKVLGWKPVQKGLLESIPEIVDGEARSLGLTKGHAVQASG